MISFNKTKNNRLGNSLIIEKLGGWPSTVITKVQFSSVQLLSHVRLFATPWLQHTRLPCPSPTPVAYSDSYPLHQWCHPTISSSVIPFSSHLQSFSAWGSFQMSQFFTSCGQWIGISTLASVLPMNIPMNILPMNTLPVNIQDWFPLGLMD